MIRMAEGRSGPTVLVYEAVSGGGLGPGDPPASWLAEGSAIRRALVLDFAAVPGVRVVEAVDARCAEPAGATPPNVARIVTNPARPIDLGRLAPRADGAVLVAPESGGQLEALARRCRGAGARSLGADPAAIALCANKLRLAEHLGRLGIPTPPTRAWRPGARLPAPGAPSGRVVVKPVDGVGAVDTFVLDRASLDRGPRRGLGGSGRLIIQPYRPGPAYSASFLVGRGGRAHLLAVGRQRIALGPRGEVRYEGGEVPAPADRLDLGPVRAAVGSVPGLLGLVGVDFVATGPVGASEVIEINPRVTTSIVGLTRLAAPGTIARAWLAATLDEPGPASFPDLAAIAAVPPVRFRADGTILGPSEAD